MYNISWGIPKDHRLDDVLQPEFSHLSSILELHFRFPKASITFGGSQSVSLFHKTKFPINGDWKYHVTQLDKQNNFNTCKAVVFAIELTHGKIATLIEEFFTVEFGIYKGPEMGSVGGRNPKWAEV